MRFSKVVLGSEANPKRAQHSLVRLVAERTHLGDAVSRAEMPRIWKDFWGQAGCLQLITPRKTEMTLVSEGGEREKPTGQDILLPGS